MVPGFGRELPDAVLVRGIAGGSFEQVTKRLGVLHALRELGVPVYNDARAIERSVDKSMTSLLLHAGRRPTPPTWATESAAQAQRIVMRESAAGHALVLKPLFGSQGKGLQLVGSVDGAHLPLPRSTALRRRWPTCSASCRRSATAASTGACWWSAAARSPRCARAARTGCTTSRRARAAKPRRWRPTLARAGRARRARARHGLRRRRPHARARDGARRCIEVNGVAAWQGLQRVTASTSRARWSTTCSTASWRARAQRAERGVQA